MNITPSFLRRRALEHRAEALDFDSACSAFDVASQVRIGFLVEQARANKIESDSVSKVVELAADRMEQRGAGDARLEADSRYYANDLTGTLTPEPIERPREEADLVDKIPVSQVDPGQKYVTMQFVDLTGAAAYMNSESTSPPISGTDRAESEPTKVEWLWTATESHWKEDLNAAFSGINNRMTDLSSARHSLDRLMNRSLLKPDAGVKIRGLKGDDLKVLRRTGLQNLEAATGDDVLEALDKAFSYIGEQTKMAMKRNNLALISPIIWNAMHRKFNFSAGGPGSIVSAIQAVMNRHGIQNIAPCPSLDGFAGAKTGAMVLLHRPASGEEDSNLSLRHGVAMMPAPVHSYMGPSGEVTVYAAAHAGLFAPNGAATLIETYKL